jgi:23S rRNA G2445 N2-methylase RlmL
MDEDGSESPAADSQRREFGSAKGLIHMADDFDPALLGEPALADWNGEEEDAAHLQQPSEGEVTPMLERAIRAAKALPSDDQDALAAAMLEWIDDERRWAESFARTHEALTELAREALAEHHAGEDLDSANADMASDESREAEVVEWSDVLLTDAADEAEEPRRAAEE